MEKVLGIENCIYLGHGFIYNSTPHEWPFSFIFNKNILLEKEVNTYSAYLISSAWLKFLKRLKQEDPKVLLSIRNKNKKTKYEIDRLFETDRCNWYLIEKEISELFENYKNKKEHQNYIKKFQESTLVKNSYAPRFMIKGYHPIPNIKSFEAVSKKNISINQKNLIGVYIDHSKKEVIENVKKILPKGKIIFTGKKIIRIK
jgi:hypothetical protein